MLADKFLIQVRTINAYRDAAAFRRGFAGGRHQVEENLVQLA